MTIQGSKVRVPVICRQLSSQGYPSGLVPPSCQIIEGGTRIRAVVHEP
jgi:hypothetical protein